MRKNKIIIMIIILIILVFICNKILTVKELKYTLKKDDNKFFIIEQYKDESYYIEIDTEQQIFPLRIYEKTGKRKLITDIHYYKDKTYECILPIIDGELHVDFMCYKENFIYNYQNIKGENKELDKYVNSTKKYNESKFIDKSSKYLSINTIKLYTQNKINNFIAITTYKGLVNSKKEITLFEEDLYNNKISTFINNYYLVADYNKKYEFNEFYVINLQNNEINKIKSKNEISFDSYIQGIVDNKVYLYDKDNENQYEIDINKNKISLISSQDKVRYYKNNKWEKINKTKANKELYFDYTSLDNLFTDYDKVIETDNFYYLFKKNDINYNLYRVDKENIDVYKFISTIPSSSIYCKKDYLYYVYKNKLFYYSDNSGLLTLLEDSELEFNNTIKYHIY